MPTELTRAIEPKVLRHWHRTLADLILAHPEATQRELARKLDRSEYWMSVVVNSDAFQEYLASRREELHNPVVVASFEQKVAAVGRLAMDKFAERIEQGAAIEHTTLLEAASLAAKVAGVGGFGQRQQGPGVNLYMVQAPPQAASTKDWVDMAGGKIVDISPGAP